MTNKILVGLIIVIVLFLAGVFFLFSKRQSPSKSASQNTTISPSPTTFTRHETTVELTPSGFSPQTVTIKKEEGILWVNKSSTKATINSADHPTHKKFPEINLGEFENNKSINHVFMTPGTYQYHNHYNPAQSGTIIVE